MGAIGLVSISAVRFATMSEDSIHDAVVNGFYGFMGVLVALSQLDIEEINKKFRFLNYHWGKFLLCFFLATISFGSPDFNIKL